MKHFLIIMSAALFCLLGQTAWAQQAKRGFEYQGLIRNPKDGKGLQEVELVVRFSLHPQGINTSDYTEEQRLKTDVYGVFATEVGKGNATAFSNLDFSAKDYWLKVEVKTDPDPTKPFKLLSDAELLAVPYAKSADYSQKSENGTQVGSMYAFAGHKSNRPAGYLYCDGSLVSKTTYADLYAVIGDRWGSGNASHFRLPDLRAAFLRGLDQNAKYDPDGKSRTIGSYQSPAIKTHTHKYSGETYANTHNHEYLDYHSSHKSFSVAYGRERHNKKLKDPQGYKNRRTEPHTHSHTFSGRTDSRGTGNMLPKTTAFYYIIKY